MNNLLILATYESFLQPLTVARLRTALGRIGYSADVIDCTVDAMDKKKLERAGAYVVTAPLFDSLRQACAIAGMLRARHGDKPLFFVGAYAELNRDALEHRFGARVLSGDYETSLADVLAQAGLSAHETATERAPWWGRTLLPNIGNYAYPGGLLPDKKVGNVETTGGCRFNCSHCTVYTLSRGNVGYRPLKDVMGEIAWLVEQGVDHISFTDAEFMNVANHGPAIVEALAARHPGTTFDVISRVDRILKYQEEFRRFAELGCVFVTTALEFPDDKVLTKLRKGYRTKHLAKLAELNEQGIRINPTLIVFSPWVDLADIERGETFLADSGLSEIIDPVQRVTRLVVVKGSPLFETDALDGVVLHEREFDYTWEHPIPEVDQLYSERLKAAGSDAIGRCCVRC
jgi:radical SAM superfamily enzyme YgiQ (UPF0313 family)